MSKQSFIAYMSLMATNVHLLRLGRKWGSYRSGKTGKVGEFSLVWKVRENENVWQLFFTKRTVFLSKQVGLLFTTAFLQFKSEFTEKTCDFHLCIFCYCY